jgi:hypothetical protein
MIFPVVKHFRIAKKQSSVVKDWSDQEEFFVKKGGVRGKSGRK